MEVQCSNAVKDSLMDYPREIPMEMSGEWGRKVI